MLFRSPDVLIQAESPERATTCNFVGRSSVSDEIVDSIADHCSFESMRSNPMTNHHDVYSIDKEISPLEVRDRFSRVSTYPEQPVQLLFWALTFFFPWTPGLMYMSGCLNIVLVG